MNGPRCVQLAVFSLVIVCGTAGARGQFGDLVRRVPDGANALMLVDADRLQASSVARQEGWRDKQDEAYRAGLILLPPETSRFVTAAKLDFPSMQSLWEMVLMNRRQDMSVPQVAQRFQGTVDRIEGREVGVLPGGFFAVRFGPRVAAVGEKASRQDVTRWIRRVDNNSLRGLSPYLAEAQQLAEQDAQIVLAVDLGDVFATDFIERRLRQSATLAGKDVDLPAMAAAVASIRGVTLAMTLTDVRSGMLRVDFGQDVSLLGDFAGPLLLEALASQGMAIDELHDWAVTVEANRVELRGRLEQSGMRRILSLFDAPPALQGAARTDSPGSEQSQQRMQLAASQTYFLAVTSLLDDLRDNKQQRRTMGQVGVWFQNYARQIDRLPILGVHPDLVEWGAFVASSLREGQVVVQESAARSRVRQAEVPEQFDVQTYSVPVGANWFGAFSWNGWSAMPNLSRTGQLRSRVRTQERLHAAMSTNMLLQQLDLATAEVRQHMTQVFGTEF